MKEENLSNFGRFWNLFWFIALILSVIFAIWEFGHTDGSFWGKLIGFFSTIVSIVATVAQVNKKSPSGFLTAVKQEFMSLRTYNYRLVRAGVRHNIERIAESEIKIKEHVTAELDRKLKGQNKGDDTYQQANMRVLEKLWPYITTRIINHIVDYVGTTALEGDIVDHSLHRYQSLRHDHPELHFIDEDIELAFSQYDKQLFRFTSFLGSNATPEPFNGRIVYLSDYQQATKLHPELNDLMGVNQERLQKFLENHHEIENRAVEMQKAHQQLIQKIQRLLPKFDFPDDLTAFKEMDESRQQMDGFMKRIRGTSKD